MARDPAENLHDRPGARGELMEDHPPQDAVERFQAKEAVISHFAWLNARLALESTMMAWVRTATTLIGFGFTIVQFFERLNNMEGVDRAAQPFAARYVGLVLIAAGVIALVVSTVQYRATIRYLWHGDFAKIAGMQKTPGNTPIYSITIGLMVVGVLAFVAVLIRAV
jgi:putative membrane protein